MSHATALKRETLPWAEYKDTGTYVPFGMHPYWSMLEGTWNLPYGFMPHSYPLGPAEAATTKRPTEARVASCRSNACKRG